MRNIDIMEIAPDWLLQYKKNIYSQMGDDGIIEKILGILPNKDRWCIEFGAWDGIHCSNTRNLIENHKYSAVLIESSQKLFKRLRQNYAKNESIITLNKCVGFSDNDNLDVILNNTLVPKNFDFLSIDVDGNDYHIWKKVTEYTPKVVCIEFNPTMPTELHFVQKADPSIAQGSSLSALVGLGKTKGYGLVSVLLVNAFFVKSEYFPLFKIKDNSPATLRKNLDWLTYMFIGYDGKIYLSGYERLPWHGIKIKQSRIQQLPKTLRKFPGNYNVINKILFIVYTVFTYPTDGIKIIKTHLYNRKKRINQ